MTGPPINYPFLADHPLQFVDVGSKDGLPSAWLPYLPVLNITGFEPDTRSFNQLSQDSHVRHLPVALSDHSGQAELFLTAKAGVSSVLHPNHQLLNEFAIGPEYQIQKTTRISVTTLDQLVKDNLAEPPDFIKIDTQGSELAILRGARNALNSSLLGVELEVVFSQMYHDQPLFSDIDPLLRSHGFTLFDISPSYFKRSRWLSRGYFKGQLLQADALYLRDPKSLHDQLLKKSPPERIRQLAKMLVCCAVYGYYDYGFKLLDLCDNIPPADRQLLASPLRRASRNISNTLPDFPARGYLARLLRHAGYYLRPVNPKGRLMRTLGNRPDS